MSGVADLTALDNGMRSQWSFRNKVINGDFRTLCWQRGVSFASPASGDYTADCWKVYFDGTGAFTVSQVASDNPDGSGKALRWNQSGAVVGGTYRSLQQPIEGVRSFAGKRVAISFKAKASGFTSLPVYISQVFGTGGSPSATVNTAADTVTIDGTLTRYTTYVDVPSVSGKTLGSNNDDYLGLSFNLPTTGTFSIDIEEVQVEELVATPFERRPDAVELMLCQRYYETGYVTLFAVATAGSQEFRSSQRFATTKRKVPTFSSSGGSTSNVSTSSFVSATVDRFDVKVDPTAAGGFSYDSVLWAASAGF